MRTLLVGTGGIIFLMGAVFALQGANVLPATFMQGPTWIGIGAAIAIVGLLAIFFGVRKKPQAP